MLERDEYPAGVPCWVDTGQPDPEAAIAFYGGLFGWDFVKHTAADPAQHYYVAQLRGRDVAGIRPEPDGAAPAVWSTYIRVDSADEAAAKVREAGGSVLAEPFDVEPAGRTGVFADPAGGVFGVWEPDQRQGAHLVNEPGTWNFSELNTPDPERAKAFYGHAFGWEVSDMGGDGGFWRMPGYGDFLAQRDPDVRARQADVGAPKGFEDAVAWLVPQTGEQSAEAAPAHWTITFAVDDADAVAERAASLGGDVLAPPSDAPWVRMTVLRDPQGAVFTASKFTPPT